jgi:hypothetical protein
MAGGSWLLFYEGLNMSKKSVGSIIKNAYLHPFRYGVANRREFWWCEFAVLFFSVLVIFIPFILFPSILPADRAAGNDFLLFAIIFIIILLFIVLIWNIVMSLAVEVRRLHDIGCSGWWVLVIRFLWSVVDFLAYGETMHNSFVDVFIIFVTIFSIIYFILIGLWKSKTLGNPYLEKARLREKIIEESNQRV